MNTFDQITKTLEQPVTVPKNVHERFSHTLYTLPEHVENSAEDNVIAFRPKKLRIPRVAAAAVAVLLIGSVSIAAGLRFNRNVQESMHLSDEAAATAERTGLAAKPESTAAETGTAAAAITTATDQGITITADQTLVDNYSALVALTVSGFDPGEDREPMLGDISLTIGGDFMNWSGSFYDGWMSDGAGYAVNREGIRMADLPESEVKYEYFDENGKLTYILGINSDGAPGALLGKEISIDIHGIGYAPGKAEYAELVDGTWHLQWMLSGTTDSRVVSLSAPLGDSGATVTELELSPISLRAVYDFPQRSIEVPVTVTEGSETASVSVQDDEPPMLMGVKLKDGTLYPSIFDGGSLGYLDKANGIYEERFGLDRVLDIDEVEAVLFLKTSPAHEEPLTEENFYVVPLE